MMRVCSSERHLLLTIRLYRSPSGKLLYECKLMLYSLCCSIATHYSITKWKYSASSYTLIMPTIPGCCIQKKRERKREIARKRTYILDQFCQIKATNQLLTCFSSDINMATSCMNCFNVSGLLVKLSLRIILTAC